MKHEIYNGAVSAKVLFCITRAYQAKLPEWREPMEPRATATSAYSQPFSNVPTLPNEHVSSVPPQRQMEFKGFSF